MVASTLREAGRAEEVATECCQGVPGRKELLQAVHAHRALCREWDRGGLLRRKLNTFLQG